MSAKALIERLRKVALQPMPLPGSGETPTRHRLLMELGREDLSLARLAEAHFDATAILAEAGRCTQPGALYGVWAAEIPGKALVLTPVSDGFTISGTKMFCSGAGIIDRALVTVGAPEPWLIDLDLRANADAMEIDNSIWKVSAFADTNTAKVIFKNAGVSREAMLCQPGWYLSRPGFWHGACGPASCWAGGAAGLLDYALRQSRSDAHTHAHLGAMHALVWNMQSALDTAGREIDTDPADAAAAHVRALTVRHLIEQAATEMLRRFARAYGPHPLAFDGSASQRYQELDIYLRQCHAERDLEILGQETRRETVVRRQ